MHATATLPGRAALSQTSAAFDRTMRQALRGAGARLAVALLALFAGIASASAAKPTVSSVTIAHVTSRGATLGATVDSDGGEEITERGVAYSTNRNFRYNDPGVMRVAAAGTTGAFTVQVTGLEPTTGYYFQAYAVNSAGAGLALGYFTTDSARAKMLVSGKGVEIPDDDTTPSLTDDTDFGLVPVTDVTVTSTFTITSTGDAELILYGTPLVEVYGDHPEDFTVTAQPTTPVAADGGTTTFTITFDPSAGGPRRATIQVASSDSFDSYRTFAVSGVGAVTPRGAVAVSSRGSNLLLHFDPTGAAAAVEYQPITGVAVGERIMTLDSRPADGALLAFAGDPVNDRGTLYSIDVVTGAATALGVPGGVAFVDANGNAVEIRPTPDYIYDMDIDPVTDQARVIAYGLNFRVSCSTGLPVDADDAVAGVNQEPPINDTHLFTGIAYTNSVAGTAVTTLYAVDLNGNLWLVDPSNSGAPTYLCAITNQGNYLPSGWVLGLDIPPQVASAASNTEVAAGHGYVITVDFSGESGDQAVKVGRVDLTTGALTYTKVLPNEDYPTSLTLLATAPTVTSPTLANLTDVSATLGGTVTDGGGGGITERGVVIVRSVPYPFAALSRKFVVGGTLGVFTVPVSDLLERTRYRYWAFATNAKGTSYSSEATFTTPETIDISGVGETAITTRGETRIYPLANEVAPSVFPLELISVSDPAITISGRALIIPAGYAGTFTYTYAADFKTGQASVTVTRGSPAVQARAFSGLLLRRTAAGIPLAMPLVAGAAEVAISPNGRVATVVLSSGTSVVRRILIFPAGSMTATRATALERLTLTRNADGTVSCECLRSSADPLTGVLQARQAAGPSRRYNVALGSIHPRRPVIFNDPGSDPIHYPSSIPGGGYACLTVAANRSVRVTGLLPDGSTFSAATSLRENNTIPLYSAVRGGVRPPSIIAGELVLADLASTDLTGEWFWRKVTQARGLNRDGFETVLTAKGSLYQGQILLAGAGELALSGGDMSSQHLGLNVTAGRPALPVGSVRSWVVLPGAGMFLAAVTEPAPARPVLGRGVYLPKSRSAWGFFPGQTVGGRIVLTVP